jgi:hypothetical protein
MKTHTARLAWALWCMAMLALATAAWLNHLLRQAGRPDLAVLDASALAVAVPHLGLATVGAVIAIRRPSNPVGWLLLLAFGVLGQASFAVAGYADYGLVARPGALPAAWLAGRYFPAMAAAAFACLGFVLLLTPTGSLPSARWRWWAIVTATTPIALLVTVALAPRRDDQPYRSPASPFDLHGYQGALLVAYQVAFAVILVAVTVAAASLVVRFRRASGTEREQLRWVALAAVLVALLFLVVLVGVVMGVPGLPEPGYAGTAALVVLTLGISAATLRYRLYDIDVIINRALVYGALTALLAAIYTVCVVVVPRALRVGGDSELVVAGSTLAVAALFQPLRRRIQGFIDRRFYRRKYDAARTVEAFSSRLRTEVDIEAMRADLLAVVQDTMQPRRVSLWLRSGW